MCIKTAISRPAFFTATARANPIRPGGINSILLPCSGLADRGHESLSCALHNFVPVSARKQTLRRRVPPTPCQTSVARSIAPAPCGCEIHNIFVEYIQNTKKIIDFAVLFTQVAFSLLTSGYYEVQLINTILFKTAPAEQYWPAEYKRIIRKRIEIWFNCKVRNGLPH
jgi:hypothetical protein